MRNKREVEKQQATGKNGEEKKRPRQRLVHDNKHVDSGGRMQRARKIHRDHREADDNRGNQERRVKDEGTASPVSVETRWPPTGARSCVG